MLGPVQDKQELSQTWHSLLVFNLSFGRQDKQLFKFNPEQVTHLELQLTHSDPYKNLPSSQDKQFEDKLPEQVLQEISQS